MFCKGEYIMKEKCWSKTLLGVYSYLDTIADAIDKITLKTALNSFYFSKSDYEKNNVLTISNKLIDLSERKVTLINLKIIIEDTLMAIPKKDALILIARYVNKQKIMDIAEKNLLSKRSIFRKISHAEEMFSNILLRKGYDSFRLKQMLKNERWILNFHNDLISKKSSDDFVISQNSLDKVVAL